MYYLYTESGPSEMSNVAAFGGDLGEATFSDGGDLGEGFFVLLSLRVL
jgi:hypothetical protein